MIVLKATQDKVLSVLQSVAGIVERRHALPVLASVLTRSGELQSAEISAAVLLYAPLNQLSPVRSMSYGTVRASRLVEGCGGSLRREEGVRHWQVTSDSGPNSALQMPAMSQMKCW